MKSLVNQDGLLFQIMSKIAELMILNICFLICCIPCVTIGASVTALYASLFLADGGSMTKRFFREFRRNFKQGSILGIILGGILLILLADVRLLEQMEGYSAVKYGIFLAGLLWLGVSTYAFGLTARFDDPIGRVLKNAVLLSISMLPRTAFMTVIDALPLIILLQNPELFSRLIIVWFLLGFAVCAWLKTWMLNDVFRALNKR